MSLYLGENLISGQATLVGESRNIGQIIPSTIPLTDAGLHLLDGSLIQGSGIYSAFVDYIASIYDPTANYFCTEVEWQTAVATYGVCGKFVYDATANTVRLPKYNSKIYTGGGTAPVVGNGMTLGLTNGTTNFAVRSYSSNAYIHPTGAYGQPIGSGIGTTPVVSNDKSIGITLDPTKSGIIAQLSDITTSLDGYYYIVIATSTKTDIQVDIDEVTTDLKGKVDKSDLAEIQCIVETYVNGTSGYRIYSDGYCEQWCYKDNWGDVSSYTFLKPFKDTNYIIVFNGYKADSTSNLGIISRTTTTINYNNSDKSLQGSMLACGFIEV